MKKFYESSREHSVEKNILKRKKMKLLTKEHARIISKYKNLLRIVKNNLKINM